MTTVLFRPLCALTRGTLILLLMITAASAQNRPGPSAPIGVPNPPETSGKSTTAKDLDRIVAVVNADVITVNELDARARAIEQQLRRQNVEVPPADVLRGQVLDRMILDRAQLQLARDIGVRVDEAQIDRAVAVIAEQNRLSIAQLRDRLSSEGTSFARFREDLRTEILVGRVREREVDTKIQISEADIDSFLAEQGGQPAAPIGAIEYNIAQILLRLPEGANSEQISRQRAKAEDLLKQAQGGSDFARLAASFSDAPEALTGGGLGWRNAERLPELFVNAVAKLNPGEVASVIRSPNGFHVLKLLDKRDSGRGKFGGAPVKQTRAKHILIRPSEILSEAEVLRRLREIKQRVEQNASSFADLAKQFSVDGSASNGGDLGWVYQGDTVPEFERAMDALEPTKISEPVRTPFGWHLIVVEDRRVDEASPDRVRQQARVALRERRADEAYQDWLRQLRDRTYVELRLE